MDEASARLRALRDPRLPAMPALLGDEAVEVLATALRADGARVLDARPAQISWRPGTSLAVLYDATVEVRPGDPPAQVHLVGYTAGELPEGPRVVEQGDARAAVWPLAADPWLPGLAAVLDRETCRGILDAVHMPPGPVTHRLRAYRPGSRAVVELHAGGTRLFAKTVRPETVPALQLRHRALHEALPVPRSHGWSAEHGLVLLEAMPGATLRDRLIDGGAVPDPRDLAALLDRLVDPDDGREIRPDAGVVSSARLLRHVLPEMAERVGALARAVVLEPPAEPPVPAHGDLHTAQLLVDEGRVTALLDVDTVALGTRGGDWASLLGHLAVLEHALPPEAAPRASAYRERVLEVAEQQSRPEVVRRAVAGTVLGLATGPFRAQSPRWPSDTRARIEIAERWLAAADRANDEELLMRRSSPSHAGPAA